MDFTQLNELLQTLPGYELLTEAMKTAAMSGALIPDSDGHWPGTSGYTPTYDIYFAALKLLPFLQAQPVVTSAGSEGTSVSVKPADWNAIMRFYRENSLIIQATGNDVLHLVPIPDPPHVRRVSMRDGGGYYGDVDTDIG